MSRYAAVIFDLDGTLFDTIADIASACNELLARYGKKPYSVRKIKKFVGLGVDNLLGSLVAGRKITTKQPVELKTEYLDIYRRRMLEQTRPYPGIIDLIVELKALGVVMAVLSNKPDADVGSLMKHFFLPEFFQVVMGKQPGFPLKPDPRAIEHIIEVLKVPKTAVLYVGDTKTDIETAINAKITSVGALWGFRSKQELIRAKAEYLAHTPADIYKLVKG